MKKKNAEKGTLISFNQFSTIASFSLIAEAIKIQLHDVIKDPIFITWVFI